MKTWLTVGLSLLLAVAIPLLAAGKGDSAKGKTVFTSRCAACHGPDGEGKESIAKMFKVQQRPLGSKEVQAKDDETLRKNILEGNGKMKPVKLTDPEVTDLIAFLRSLAKK